MTTYPNWFASYADDYFTRHLSHLAGQPNLRFLQIGAFTGDASVWLLDNVLRDPENEVSTGSRLIDVDTWRGSDEPEHEPFDWSDVERRYDQRTFEYRQERRLYKIKGSSSRFFDGAILDEECQDFDFIYIDGSHLAADVLSDAVHAFEVLESGGLMAFDDYAWKPRADADLWECPGVAIDAFTACYFDRLDILEAGLQVWVRKK